MKVFGTLLELCDFAFANLELKLRLKSKLDPKLFDQKIKIKRSLIDVILREEKKNLNRKLAIAKLLFLLRFLEVEEQKMKVYHVLAIRLSQCDEGDLDFLDFIIYKGSYEFMNRSRMDIVFAMCYVAKYKITSVPDGAIETLFDRYAFLKSLGLSFYFEPPIFSLDNKRRKFKNTEEEEISKKRDNVAK